MIRNYGVISSLKHTVMARFLKKGKSASEIKAADVKVRDTVENIIRDIEENGDAAVRKYSTTFDKWSPASFRLTDEEIGEIVARTPRQVKDDILFAQRQIRYFAEQQLASISDIEVDQGLAKPNMPALACPECLSKVKAFQYNDEMALFMCQNIQVI